MTDLSSFSEAERLVIASLPYKVGIWVSHAEDEEGEEDDHNEIQALHRCVTEIVRSHEDNAFIQSVMREMLTQKQRWGDWADEAFHVIRQIGQVKPALQRHLSEAEYKSFCKVLIEIAIVVAEAHGEFGDWGDEPEEGVFSSFLGKVKERFSAMTDSTQANPMNISAAEEASIKELKAVLKPA